MTQQTAAEIERVEEISGQRYRHVLGHFVTGVTVVTAMHADGPVGFTCQSFGALSLDPPLIFICPSRTSRSWPKAAASGRFAVNVLADDQTALGRRFAASVDDRFADVSWTPGRFTGAPMLPDTLGRLECEIETMHAAGDHWIVVARVLDLAAVTDRGPLTFFRGTLAGMTSIVQQTSVGNPLPSAGQDPDPSDGPREHDLGTSETPTRAR